MAVALLAAVLTLLSLGHALEFKHVGDTCSTPDSKAGICRLIRDCPPIYALLHGDPTREDMDYLRRSTCGFQGIDPILCCAVSVQTPRPEPSTPTPRPQTPVDSGPPHDVSNHPNVRLLPLDVCSAGFFDRITGGKEADLYGYPFIARIGYWTRRSTVGGPLSYRCGGSLINSNYVLTAAHCVTNLPGQLRLGGVRLGEYRVDTEKDCSSLSPNACLPPALDYEVEEVVVHPEYNRVEMANDIALLRLRGRVDFSREEYVRPVCLPVGPENQNLRLDNTKMTTAGWGTTEFGEGSRVLLDVKVPVVPMDRCRKAYADLGTNVRITNRQLCAGGEKGRDSCTGDSGGPLLHAAEVNEEQKGVQFGIVSFGPRNCGTGGVPGIYTRVAYYMDWILDSIRP